MRKKFMLLLLLLIFIMPGLSAYYFYTHPQWLSKSTTNRGQLVEKPQQISLGTEKKWGLVLWWNKPCDSACIQQLDKLARIRLALGRRLYQVNMYLLLPENIAAPSLETQQMLKEKGIEIKRISVENPQKLPFSKETLAISDPKNFVVLTYALGQNPMDIFADMKQLLSVAEKNS